MLSLAFPIASPRWAISSQSTPPLSFMKPLASVSVKFKAVLDWVRVEGHHHQIKKLHLAVGGLLISVEDSGREAFQAPWKAAFLLVLASAHLVLSFCSTKPR